MRTIDFRRFAAIGAVTLSSLALAAFWGAASALVGGVLPLLLIISFGAAALILFDYRLGVLLLIVTLPISHTTLFPHELFGVAGLNPLNLLFVATLGSYAVARLTGQSTVRIPYSKTLLIWYVLPITIAGFYGATQVKYIPEILRLGATGESNLGVGNSRQFLQFYVLKPMLQVFFAHLVALGVYQTKSASRYWIAFLISLQFIAILPALVVGISGLSLDILAASFARQFLSGLGLHANELGPLYGFGFALVLFTWPHLATLRSKFAALVVLASTALSIMLTFSRGGYVFFLTVCVAFLVKRRQFRTIVAAFVLGGVGFALLPQAVYDRVLTGFDPGSQVGSKRDELTAGRVHEIWLPLLPDLAAHPIAGNGKNAIMWSSAVREGRIAPLVTPHNLYLRLALDMGLLGFLAMTVVVVWLRREFRQLAGDTSIDPRWRGMLQGAGVALLAYLVAGVANGDYAPAPETTFLWLAIGIALGLRQRVNESGTAIATTHVRH